MAHPVALVCPCEDKPMRHSYTHRLDAEDRAPNHSRAEVGIAGARYALKVDLELGCNLDVRTPLSCLQGVNMMAATTARRRPPVIVANQSSALGEPARKHPV